MHTENKSNLGAQRQTLTLKGLRGQSNPENLKAHPPFKKLSRSANVRRIAPEQYDRIETWVNEGGAGEDIDA